MRIITAYACTLDVETAEEALWRFNLYRGVMDDWLRDQGISDPRSDSPSDTFIRLTRRDVSHEGAEIDGFLLKQPVLESSHVLHTEFDLAAKDESLAMFLRFSVERRTNRIAPASLQVGCPRALATILDTGNWLSGQVRVRSHRRRVFGAEAGRQLKSEIWNPNRTLPVVLIANLGGPEWAGLGSFRPEPYSEAEWQAFADALEADIGAVAQVAEVDLSASEAMDPDMDGLLVWVIWPFETEGFVVDQHPAWAPYDYYYYLDEEDGLDYPLHYGGSGTPPAPWISIFRRHELQSLRPKIRETIYEQAALQPIPELIGSTRSAFEKAERKRLSDTGDWQEYAESFERDAKQAGERANNFQKRLESVEQELKQEREKTRELQAALRQRKSATSSVTSKAVAPPTEELANVLQSLHVATRTCQSLVFGRDVWDSANKIDSEPALTRKLMAALQALNEGTHLATTDQLGTSLADWIYQQCAIESSPDGELRTFKDKEGEAHDFSMHLKLKEATAANKAVRIYYDHLSEHGKTLVGYIGPHL